jgi:hypothetical protein
MFGVLGLASLVVLVLTSRPWNAFFLIDSESGVQAAGFPGQDFLRLLFTHATNEQHLIGSFYGSVLSVQAVIALLLAGGAAALAYIGWRRRGPDVMEIYPAAAGLAVVLAVVALNSNAGAWNRSVVLAAPCVVCLRRLPLAALCVIVVIVGATTAVLSATFFDGRLV